jgi:hypothetical protein
MDAHGSTRGMDSPRDLSDSYFVLLNGLSADKKLRLAERLIESVRNPAPERSIESFYGAWISEKSAEEIIEEIYSARMNAPDREPLD